MSKDTWMKNFTASQRYETVLSDLLDKIHKASSVLDELEDLDDS